MITGFDSGHSRRALPPFEQGSIPFLGPNFLLARDATNLFWDDTNNRLGVLTSTPAATVSVGVGSLLRVAGADGDLERIKNIPYDWPAANAVGALNNDGAGTLSWAAPAPAAHNLLSAAHGDTVANAVTRGSLIVGNSTPAWDELVIGVANRVLRSNGTDAAWAQVVLTTDVTGTLPVGNGGTGTATTFTQGSVVFAGASGVYTQDNANFFWNDTDNRLGIGTATPTTKIHAVIGSGGAVTTSADMAIIAQSDAAAGDSASLAAVAGATGVAALFLGTRTNSNVGRVAYDNNLNALQLYVLDTERVRVTSGGLRSQPAGVSSAAIAAVDITDATSDYLVCSTAGSVGTSVFRVSQTVTHINSAAVATHDLRFDGDTATHVLFGQSSTNRVGILTSTPSEELHVVGDAIVTGIVYGGTAAGDNLDLDPSSAANYTGSVRVNATASDYGAELSIIGLVQWPNGFTHGGAVSAVISGSSFTSAVTIDANETLSTLNMYNFAPAVAVNAGVTGAIGVIGFNCAPSLTNAHSGLAVTGAIMQGFQFAPNWTNSGGGGSTITAANIRGFRSNPGAVSGVPAGVTITTLRHFHAEAVTVAGTVTTMVAYDTDIATGTTCRSFRSTNAAAQMAHAGSAVFAANAAATNASVGLEVQSTTQALLVSRMTTAQRDAMTPVDGMIIYNTTTATMQGRVAGAWVNL